MTEVAELDSAPHTASAREPIEVSTSDDLLAPPEDRRALRRPLEPASFTFGLTSLLLLVALLVAKAAGSAPAVEAFILLFGLVGLGSAPLQLIPAMRGARFLVTAIGLSLAIVLLTGTLLVELRIWSYGTAVFVVYAVVAAALHGRRMVHDLRRIPPGAMRSAIGRSGIVAPGSLAIVLCGVIGIDACLYAAVANEHLIPKPGGYATSAHPLWFVGVGFLLLGLFVAWRWRPAVLGFATVVVVLVLTATPSVVYEIARYDWTQGHVGLTLYYIQHGNGGVASVYQAWPGFFGGIAWLLHAGGVSNVEALARWWPPVVDLVGAVLVRCLAQTFGVSRRNAWLAAFLFTAANTIGQDYFSPQAMAYLGFLVMLALAVKPQTTEGAWIDVPGSTLSRVNWAVLLLLGVGIGVSHPLTPFVTSGMFVILAVFSLLRSRWMVLLPLIPATAWTVIHAKLVSQFLKLSDIGNVGANLQSPSTSFHYHYTVYARVGDLGQAAAPLLVGVLALVALCVRRDRVAWALALGAGSTGVLVVAVHYGNEDIFRAALFALPLLTVLAVRVRWHRTRTGSALIALLIPLIVVMFVIGDMGFDYIYVVRPTDLTSVQYFENTAPPGSTLITASDQAYSTIESTSRYQIFVFDFLNLPKLLKDDKSNPVRAVADLSKSTLDSVIGTYERTGKAPNYYALTQQQAAAEWAEGGVVSLDAYRSFSQALDRSSAWKKVAQTGTATLYRFVTDDLNLQNLPRIRVSSVTAPATRCSTRVFNTPASLQCLVVRHRGSSS
jgi:hypothetical protein